MGMLVTPVAKVYGGLSASVPAQGPLGTCTGSLFLAAQQLDFFVGKLAGEPRSLCT